VKSLKFEPKKLDRYKDLFPDDISFTPIVGELSIVLYHLDETSDKEFEKHLKNYLIIRLVSIMEIYFQNLVVRLVDDYDLPLNNLFKNENVNIPLSIFDKIKKFSKGKIIATNLRFQSRLEINEVFSSLLDYKFIEQIKKQTVKEDPPNPFIRNWDKFLEIFDERHLIIHALDSVEKYSKKQMRQIIEAAEMFTVLTNVLAYSKIFTTHEKSFEKNLPQLHSWLYMNIFRKPKKS
jgi:hypothetical protein